MKVKILPREEEARGGEEESLYRGAKLVSIYPNPTEGEFSLKAEFNYEAPLELSIKNMMGVEMQTTRHLASQKTHQITIDGSGYASGMYFITIQNKYYQKVLKLVKR